LLAIQPLKALIDTTIVNANGNYLPAFLALRSPPCSATTASKPAATWPRETPDAEPHDPEGHAHDHLHRGAAATWVCLAFILSIPDMGAVMSGAYKDPIVHTGACGHG